jgi:hypothetical protein
VRVPPPVHYSEWLISPCIRCWCSHSVSSVNRREIRATPLPEAKRIHRQARISLPLSVHRGTHTAGWVLESGAVVKVCVPAAHRPSVQRAPVFLAKGHERRLIRVARTRERRIPHRRCRHAHVSVSPSTSPLKSRSCRRMFLQISGAEARSPPLQLVAAHLSGPATALPVLQRQAVGPRRRPYPRVKYPSASGGRVGVVIVVFGCQAHCTKRDRTGMSCSRSSPAKLEDRRSAADTPPAKLVRVGCRVAYRQGIPCYTEASRGTQAIRVRRAQKSESRFCNDPVGDRHRHPRGDRSQVVRLNSTVAASAPVVGLIGQSSPSTPCSGKSTPLAVGHRHHRTTSCLQCRPPRRRTVPPRPWC